MVTWTYSWLIMMDKRMKYGPNNGQGVFFDSGQRLGAQDGRHAALGDIDSDGDLDAFVMNWQQADTIWTNDGTGIFLWTAVTHSAAATARYVVVNDFDGDSDLDAYCVYQGQADKLWTNNGAGLLFDSGQSLDDSAGIKRSCRRSKRQRCAGSFHSQLESA